MSWKPKTIRENKGKSLLTFPNNYVVIDLETTGLDPQWDQIIEFGAIRYEQGIESGRFQSLVYGKVDEFIAELTGITNEMLMSAPHINQILPEFLAFVGDSIIVAHNANFDVNFIYDTALCFKLPSFKNDFIDTMRLGRRLYPDLPHHTLSALCSEFGITEELEHRAIADCIRAQKCLTVMKDKADTLGGIPMPVPHSRLAKSIKAETDSFNPDSPIFGMVFAFTGRLDRMTRKEAMQAVVNAGGICGDGVTAATNYLVLGINDYCKAAKGTKSAKQKKAEKMQRAGASIATISEDVFYDMLEA